MHLLTLARYRDAAESAGEHERVIMKQRCARGRIKGGQRGPSEGTEEIERSIDSIRDRAKGARN